MGATSLKNQPTDKALRGAGVFLGFSEHATAVQCIVDDLAHCRRLWVDVHSVARFEMSDDTLCSYVKRQAIEL